MKQSSEPKYSRFKNESRTVVRAEYSTQDKAKLIHKYPGTTAAARFNNYSYSMKKR